MPKGKGAKSAQEANVADYRCGTKRKNIPLAGLAAQDKVKEALKLQFAYNPHLPPVLRFDDTGGPDKLPPLSEKARKGPLTADETKAMKGAIDEERFAALSGTTSLPFPPGEHERCAVKLIDPRGNEVMRVHRPDEKTQH